MSLDQFLKPDALSKLSSIGAKMPDAAEEQRKREIRNIVTKDVSVLIAYGIKMEHRKRNCYFIPEIQMTVKVWVNDDNTVAYNIGKQIFNQQTLINHIIKNSKSKA